MHQVIHGYGPWAGIRAAFFDFAQHASDKLAFVPFPFKYSYFYLRGRSANPFEESFRLLLAVTIVSMLIDMAVKPC